MNKTKNNTLKFAAIGAVSLIGAMHEANAVSLANFHATPGVSSAADVSVSSFVNGNVLRADASASDTAIGTATDLNYLVSGNVTVIPIAEATLAAVPDVFYGVNAASDSTFTMANDANLIMYCAKVANHLLAQCNGGVNATTWNVPADGSAKFTAIAAAPAHGATFPNFGTNTVKLNFPAGGTYTFAIGTLYANVLLESNLLTTFATLTGLAGSVSGKGPLTLPNDCVTVSSAFDQYTGDLTLGATSNVTVSQNMPNNKIIVTKNTAPRTITLTGSHYKEIETAGTPAVGNQAIIKIDQKCTIDELDLTTTNLGLYVKRGVLVTIGKVTGTSAADGTTGILFVDGGGQVKFKSPITQDIRLQDGKLIKAKA